jgi:hypothetical protein
MEQHLPGGLVNAVVRIGDTVRRPPSPNATFVHALLGHFEQHGWDGAPRYLGMDADGREVLSYLDGHVGWAPRQPAAVSPDQSLAEVARLVRQFHDLTAGTPLAGPAEVVCHNDLSPSNTVSRDHDHGLPRWRSSTGTWPRRATACTTSPTPAGSTCPWARPSPTWPVRCGACGWSATATAWMTAAGWSRRSCGGRTAAGAASRPARQRATWRCSGCATTAPPERSGPPMPG